MAYVQTLENKLALASYELFGYLSHHPVLPEYFKVSSNPVLKAVFLERTSPYARNLQSAYLRVY
jgi:hypothetical protein